jgi:hypothetical protein
MNTQANRQMPMNSTSSAAIVAFEDRYKVDARDPAVEPELNVWLEAWSTALSNSEGSVSKAQSTAPKRIYLDLGSKEALEFEFKALDEVTWSADNASGTGIPYVRADLAATRADQPSDEQIKAKCIAHGFTNRYFDDAIRFVRDILALASVAPTTPAADEAVTDALRLLTKAEHETLLESARERDRLDALVNSPQTVEFLSAVAAEKAHQIERWGQAHDRGKSAENWFWLVGYLAGKCLRACIIGDREQALHHTISSAAALANWHQAINRDETGTGIGHDNDIKPVELAHFEKAEA